MGLRSTAVNTSAFINFDDKSVSGKQTPPKCRPPAGRVTRPLCDARARMLLLAFAILLIPTTGIRITFGEPCRGYSRTPFEKWLTYHPRPAL